MFGQRLHGIEWLELAWRVVLVALLVWFGFLVRDLALLRATDAATTAWAWSENHARQTEQIRLLKAICIQTAIVYDVARGVCEPQGTTEPKRPEVPKLKGGPYGKR